MPNKTLNCILSCVVFLAIVVAMILNYDMMLKDPDTGWHLMAGDLIRSLGKLPATDPWSFTANGHPWINLSWLWDVGMSVLNEHLGWYGQLLFNATCMALTLLIIFNICLFTTNNGIASAFVVLLILVSIALHLRPLWASNVFLAGLFYLALLVQYRNWSVKWWYVMPALMPLWINIHGGFIVAFVLLGAYGLQALIQKDWRMAAHLTCVGLLSIAAMATSPYSMKGVLSIIFMTMDTASLDYISEFQPTTMSWSFFVYNTYATVFLYFVICHKMRASIAENILAFGLLILAFTCVRYWNFFYLFSAPLLASHINNSLSRSKQKAKGNALAMRYADAMKQYFCITHAVVTRYIVILLTIAATCILYTPKASGWFGLAGYKPYQPLESVLSFVEKHHPHTRFFTDYTLGGPLIYLSQGAFPVFVDGRGGTAYPQSVVQAYVDAKTMKKGCEMLDDYKLDGAIVYSDTIKMVFESCVGWKRVYHDDNAWVFIRSGQ